MIAAVHHRHRPRADRDLTGDDGHRRAGAAADGSSPGDRVRRRRMLFLLSIVLVTASVFFLLRAATAKRLQVESTLARIPGYGYASDDPRNDLRSLLRRIGRIAPGGHGPGAETLRIKLAAAGWSRLVTPEDAGRAQDRDAAGRLLPRPDAGADGRWCRRSAAVLGGLLGAGMAYIGLPVCDRPAGAQPARPDRGGAAHRARPADAVGRGRHELRRGARPVGAPTARAADGRAVADAARHPAGHLAQRRDGGDGGAGGRARDDQLRARPQPGRQARRAAGADAAHARPTTCAPSSATRPRSTPCGRR